MIRSGKLRGVDLPLLRMIHDEALRRQGGIGAHPQREGQQQDIRPERLVELPHIRHPALVAPGVGQGHIEVAEEVGERHRHVSLLLKSVRTATVIAGPGGPGTR